MGNWFDTVFLPSLYSRSGTTSNLWLSQKQTTICCENMAKSSIRYDAGCGEMYSHNTYRCEWDGREVTLEYSKKNGCGCIRFGKNVDEIKIASAEHAIEKNRIESEKIRRIKSNPARLEKMVTNLKTEIANREESLRDAIEDGEKSEYIKIDAEKITELKAELALYI